MCWLLKPKMHLFKHTIERTKRLRFLALKVRRFGERESFAEGLLFAIRAPRNLFLPLSCSGFRCLPLLAQE